MIINKNDLKEGKLTEEIVREISLLANTLTKYEFHPLELKFALKELPDIKTKSEGYY